MSVKSQTSDPVVDEGKMPDATVGTALRSQPVITDDVFVRFEHCQADHVPATASG